MHAASSRARVTMLPLLSSLCAVALLLSPASADQESLGPAVAGDSWPADSPAKAPTAVAAALESGEWAEEAVVADAVVAVPSGRQTPLRPRHHPSALSPEARRGLEHEAHCGPRVPGRRGGVFPWPGWKPRCRGGGDATRDGGAPIAPAVHHRLQPLFDEP